MNRLASLFLLTLSAAVIEGADWPQFLGPHRDGTAPDESIVASIKQVKRPILWRIPAGEGFSGPVVVGTTVYLFHQPDREEILEAIDTKTGQSRWKLAYATDYAGGYGTGPGPRATPAVTKGLVITFGATGTIQGADALSGKLLWRRDLSKEYAVPEGFFGVGTSPLIDGDQILVTVGAPKASLVSFDPTSGKTRWIASDDQASYASPIAAKLAGKHLGIFFARTGLHLVESETGKEVGFFRWRARMNASVNAATPLVVGDQIFISAEYGTGATLLRWTGSRLEQVWAEQDSLVCHFNTPIEFDGHLFGIDGRQEGGAQLRCVKLASGEPTWSEPGFGCASLTRVGKTIIALTEDGDLVLFDADITRYQERGRQRIGTSPTRAHPALSNGVLYVRTPAELLAIDLKP